MLLRPFQTEFSHESSGAPVSHDQFLMLLRPFQTEFSHESSGARVSHDQFLMLLCPFQTEFSHESSGARVSRDQFLMILANIDALQIRASYYTVVNFIRSVGIATCLQQERLTPKTD